MPLSNFGYVDSRHCNPLFRCAQPTAADVQTLRVLGVANILKLNTDEPDEADWPDPQVFLKPLPSVFFDPKLAIECAAEVFNMLEHGGALVHCKYGRDRTGLVIGAFRIIYCGWTLAQVDAERATYGVVGLDEIADADLTAMLAIIAKTTTWPVSGGR